MDAVQYSSGAPEGTKLRVRHLQDAVANLLAEDILGVSRYAHQHLVELQLTER